MECGGLIDRVSGQADKVKWHWYKLSGRVPLHDDDTGPVL